MKVCALASGSKGNAIYIQAGETKVLIDAGLSGREIRRRLAGIGVHGEDLSAIVVSHEHVDHTRGLGVLSRQLNLPVYINNPTLSHLKGKEIKGDVREFESGVPFSVEDLSFQPFSVPHDAADPVGFTVEFEECRIGIATDLGFATRLVIERLKKCDLLILEFNHDEEMLKSGPYPWELKQRIKGRLGHLSNRQAGALLEEIHHGGLRHLILFHMSETNNHPQRATEEVSRFPKSCEYDPMKFSLAAQESVGKLISVRPEKRWI